MNSSRSRIISAADWYLSLGFFCIARMVICSSPSGMELFISRGLTGSVWSCIIATETELSDWKGS